MSAAEQGVAQEINRIKSAVTESYNALRGLETSLGRAYDVIASKGGTVPADKTIENLEQAIGTVSGGPEDIWWSPRMTSNTTSKGSLCSNNDDDIDSDYAWWTPRMISNTEAVKTSLVEAELQEKTIAPASIAQVVVPDSEYDGLSKVTVSAAALQEKTITPTSTAQVVTPDSGNYGLSKVMVGAAPLQEKSVTPTSSSQEITPDSGSYGLSKVTVAAAPTTTPSLQSKSVTPSTSSQTIGPDSGYDGLSQVTVGGISLQSKSVTPSTSSQTVTPGSGYQGLSSVSVGAVSLQSKSVTPSTSSQTVTPGSGYLGLSQVSVSAIPSKYVDTSDATATAEDVLEGKTVYVNGSKVTGTATLTETTFTKVKLTIQNASGTKVHVWSLSGVEGPSTAQVQAGVGYEFTFAKGCPVIIRFVTANTTMYVTCNSGTVSMVPDLTTGAVNPYPEPFTGKVLIGTCPGVFFTLSDASITITTS